MIGRVQSGARARARAEEAGYSSQAEAERKEGTEETGPQLRTETNSRPT